MERNEIKVPLWCVLLLVVMPFFSRAQDNYEIQVYGSETVSKDTTIAELHSNFTFDAVKGTENNGVYSNEHLFHETIEITHGFTDCFELGIYFFNAVGSDGRTGYVGSHIRPRIMAPEEWNWPVGVSLSVEFGYQKPEYSEDDWSMEIRPIVDKRAGNLYLSFNPTFEKSFHGLNKDAGLIFSPNFKAAFSLSDVVAAGFEYYGSVGTLNNIEPVQSQEHLLFFAADLTWSPLWEFNCGYGMGLTKSTDNGIVKVLFGRRF